MPPRSSLLASRRLAGRALALVRPPAGALSATVHDVELENAGAVAWRSEGRDSALSYHWLDELGNPIVWDGLRSR